MPTYDQIKKAYEDTQRNAATYEKARKQAIRDIQAEFPRWLKAGVEPTVTIAGARDGSLTCEMVIPYARRRIAIRTTFSIVRGSDGAPAARIGNSRDFPLAIDMERHEFYRALSEALAEAARR